MRRTGVAGERLPADHDEPDGNGQQADEHIGDGGSRGVHGHIVQGRCADVTGQEVPTGPVHPDRAPGTGPPGESSASAHPPFEGLA